MVHLSTKTYGVADASESAVKVDLGGASAIGSVSLVVLQDVAVDAVSRRGMASAMPLLPVPKVKPVELLFTNSAKGKRRRMKDEELEKEVEGDAARDEEVALQKEVVIGPETSLSGDTFVMDNVLELEWNSVEWVTSLAPKLGCPTASGKPSPRAVLKARAPRASTEAPPMLDVSSEATLTLDGNAGSTSSSSSSSSSCLETPSAPKASTDVH